MCVQLLQVLGPQVTRPSELEVLGEVVRTLMETLKETATLTTLLQRGQPGRAAQMGAPRTLRPSQG